MKRCLSSVPSHSTVSGRRACRYSLVSHATRFGTNVDSPHQAAAVLRARASRHDVSLGEVSPVALAAAVIAVECWMEALGADSLEHTSRFGASAHPSLAAAFELAARGVVPDPVPHEEQADLERFLGLLERLDGWLRVWFPRPGDRVDAVLFAAACLAVGADPRLASLAELLETWSSDL